MSRLRGYLVIHEVERSPDRTDYGIAGGPYAQESPGRVITALEAAENQLAYCQAMQAAERPGSEGRYLIAEYRETIYGNQPGDLLTQIAEFHERWGATHVDDIDQLALWEELGRLLNQRLAANQQVPGGDR